MACPLHPAICAGRVSMGRHLEIILLVGFCLAADSFAHNVFAAHPLLTDDTGTQGWGGLQFELNGMLGYDAEGKIKERTHEFATALSYGFDENIDFVLGIPYRRVAGKAGKSAVENNGFSDISLELKWRFLDVAGFTFAVKPGLTLPTGNYLRGFGMGKPTYGLMFISTKEFAPCTLHANVGYHRNENKISERTDIWHVSLASEIQIFDRLKIVGNIGAERNRDRTSAIPPAFVIGGFIYSLGKDVDINFGLQFGITKTETDYVLHPGITYRFNLQ
jgi:outer membrane putative beta-barrel porin/alpha-amylase